MTSPPSAIERFAMGNGDRDRLGVVLAEDARERRTKDAGW